MVLRTRTSHLDPPPAPSQGPTSSQSPTRKPLNPRLLLLTLSIAVITATGAYMGATLKTETEKAVEVEVRREEGVRERMERLRGYRVYLEERRRDLVERIEGTGGEGGKRGWER